MLKDNSAPSINDILWYYLGTNNFDYKHENNKTLLIEKMQ